ncbi:hypothetical protein [Pseudomonas shirazensis]
MENLINQENLENIRELIESKIADVPAEYILYGALGSLIVSSFLNKTGHKQAGSFVGKLSIPIIAVGLKKYSDYLKTESEFDSQTTLESYE